MSKNIENSITVAELLIDRKTEATVKQIINGTKTDNSFLLLMRFFATDKYKFPANDYGRYETELESQRYNEIIYETLKWTDSHYDIINSFWTVFSWAMHSEFPRIYQVAKAGNVRIYKNDYLRDGKLIYESFPKCFFKEEELRNRVAMLSKHFEGINTLAAYVHTVANFMPCPTYPFNSIKGTHPEVQDFFPLMIDLIDKCRTMKLEDYEKSPIRYTVDGKSKIVNYDIIKKWHSYFSGADEKFGDVRIKYCLEDYYYIYCDSNNVKHIKGIPLFEKQRLEHPLPLETEEVAQCLDEMVKRIKIRAYRLHQRQQQTSK